MDCENNTRQRYVIVTPVRNEEERLENTIRSVANQTVRPVEWVIVDDGSTDGTRELLRGKKLPDNVTFVEHERNRGKGAALRTGLVEARGTYTAIMDADLEYSPEDISALLQPLRAGEATAVFGTRGFESHSAYSFWYVIGNHAVTFMANLIYNSWISDMMTGHKAMEAGVFRSLRLRERGFAIEAGVTGRLLGQGIRIYEVPVVYRARSRDEGKKLTALDGVRVLGTLLRCRLL